MPNDPFPAMKNVRTYPLASRKSLVELSDFCETPEPPPGFAAFVDSLPDIYAGKLFKELADRIVAAKIGGKPVAVPPGAHLPKGGPPPLLIGPIRRRGLVLVGPNTPRAVHLLRIR